MHSPVIVLVTLAVSVISHPSGSSWAAQGPSGWHGALAEPQVGADGVLADTAEVAAARAAHLAALETARASNPDQDDGHYDPEKYGDHRYGIVDHHDDLVGQAKEYAALVNAVDASNAWAPQSAEAKAAKAQDEALWRAKSQSVAAADEAWATSQVGGANTPWSGPLASPSLLASGYLADTAEVAAARSKHLGLLAEAARWASPSDPKHWD